MGPLSLIVHWLFDLGIRTTTFMMVGAIFGMATGLALSTLFNLLWDRLLSDRKRRDQCAQEPVTDEQMKM